MRALAQLAGRPSVWIAIAVLVTAVSAASTPGSSVEVTYSDLALVTAVIIAGVQFLRQPSNDVLRTVPAVGFVLLGLVSVVIAVLARDPSESLVGAARFLQLFCLVPLAVMIALRTRTDAWIILGALVGLGVFQGVVGVSQTLTGTGAEIAGRPIRAVGTYGAYNIGSLAEVTGLTLIVALAVAVVATGRVRWIALATAAFLVLPLAFSLGRGAWVATAAAVLVTLSRGRLTRFLLATGAVALVGSVALPVIEAGDSDLSDRLASVTDVGSTPDQSVIDRLALWQAARQMAYDRPLIGVGPRAFADHRDAYADLSLLGSSDIAQSGDFQRVELESPHNFYLLVASEQGLVAAWVYTTFFLLLLARCLVRAARKRSDASTAVTLAAAGVMVFELVGMISGDLGGPGSILLAVALGLAGWGAADLDLPALPAAGPRGPIEDGRGVAIARPGGGPRVEDRPGLVGAGVTS